MVDVYIRLLHKLILKERRVRTGEIASCKIVPFLMSLRVWGAKEKKSNQDKI